MADVYMEAQCGAEDTPPQELHRFLVHCPDGGRLESVSQKRCALNGFLGWPCRETWWPGGAVVVEKKQLCSVL